MMNDHEKFFFRYFLKTYIPRFMRPIPTDIHPSQFSKMLTSTFDVWDVMERKLPTLPISDRLKELLITLFSHVNELYDDKLIAESKGVNFHSWLAQDSVQMRWKEMQHVSCDIQHISEMSHT